MILVVILYGLVVIADVAITIKSVRLGIAKEANILLAPLVHKPVLFIAVELVLYITVNWFAASYSSAVLLAILVMRVAFLANNINVVMGMK